MIVRLLTVFAAVVPLASAAYPFRSKRAMSKNTRKARMAAKLLENAKETDNSQLGKNRKLNQQAEPDLSIYEVKFQQCQFVKAYDDELAEDEDSKTVLGVKRFVTFRLCPANNCESCAYDFGEYVVDMDTYLEAATEYFVQDREGMCQMCEEVCYADDDATKNAGAAYVDCDSCVDYCAYFENMDENGKYMESYMMAECQQVYASDDGTEIYAGAICSNSGASIKIGAFSDEYCSQMKKNINIENYLENGLAFDDSILENVTNVDSCVSCIAKDYEIPEQNDQQQQNDQEEVEVNEMCEQLYEMAAKCESKYGFDNWWKDYEDYENQYVQEDLVCDFISSLGNGNYDEYGEIVLSGSSFSGGSGATGGQKFALTVFILSTVGLAVYGASLHSQLTKGGKADLSSQGGAMA
jgi:hypothetical protein